MQEDSQLNDYQKNYLSFLLRGDKAVCMRLTKDFLETGSGITELYEQLFREVLYHVGYLWEVNQISVAKEHLATAITESIMNSLYENIIAGNHIPKKIIVACAEQEQHQVGAKMVADIFEQKGWNSIFIGASTPLNELLAFIDDENPDAIAVSLSIYFNMRSFIQMIQKINTRYPALTVLIGGQAFRYGIPGELLKNDKNKYVDNLKSLNILIDNWERSLL